MVAINFTSEQEANQQVELEQGETVLDGLLRAGHDIPYGCRAGVCQSCIMQCSSKNMPSQAQQGLKPAQKELGYFLACNCLPSEIMDVSTAVSKSEKVSAKILEKTYLNNNVLRLRIDKVFDYKPGQFCTLWKNKTVSRCYSLASIPQKENFLEFHIKKLDKGQFSKWAHNDLQVGDSIGVQGPLGECFYSYTDISKPLFLAGIGTGLSPLYGVLRDALERGHNGNINLVLGAKNADDFYLVDDLLALERRYIQLNVHFVAQTLLKSDDNKHIVEADIYEYIHQVVPDFKNQRVFLCGADSFVKKMKRRCFMAGANMPDISADAFLAFNQ